MENSRNSPFTEWRLIPVRVADSLRGCAEEGQRIVVAYSGGLDSTVLLHAAMTASGPLGLRLEAFHVNHELSPNAGAWEEQCAATCRRWGIPLRIGKVSVNRRSPSGLEGEARSVRYAMLDSAGADRVLLAHHADDQAETLLLNLLRGAGVHGMSGMAWQRGPYLRPLLPFRRAAIEAYAREHGLDWVDDESNADPMFGRNFIRHHVLPVMEERFPAVRNLARAAVAHGEAAALLDDLARIDGGDRYPLPLGALAVLEPRRAANLLAYAVRKHCGAVAGRRRLLEILRQLLVAGDDRQPAGRIGRFEIRRFHGGVWFVNPADVPESHPWNGPSEIAWGDLQIRSQDRRGQGVARHRLTAPVCFKRRRGGERFKIGPRSARRPVKDFLREAGVPPWWRDKWPLMYCGDQLVWVPAVGVAAEFRCEPEEEGLELELHGANW